MSFTYDAMAELASGAGINWTTATIEIRLLDPSYTPDRSHPFFDSGAGANNPSANEVSDPSYAPLAIDTPSLATVANIRELRANAAVFDTPSDLANVTVGYVVVIINTGTLTTSPMLFLIDDELPQTMPAAPTEPFTVAWPANGAVGIG